MRLVRELLITKECVELESIHLKRAVRVDFYHLTGYSVSDEMNLLLINDGQDLEQMQFENLLSSIYKNQQIQPTFFAAIHANEERKQEYGASGQLDYKGRGKKADAYANFILKELLPSIYHAHKISGFRRKAFAGFSLGALSALDIVWNHPSQFSIAGVFSGSLWWRSKDQYDNDYDDDLHRIMHQRIRNGNYSPGLSFFFQCGKMDEKWDRNKNGVIDSIDDTLDLIDELHSKGYSANDIHYLLLEDGKHDVETWGKAMPVFLQWAFK